jgi:hypothetical protein
LWVNQENWCLLLTEEKTKEEFKGVWLTGAGVFDGSIQN